MLNVFSLLLVLDDTFAFVGGAAAAAAGFAASVVSVAAVTTTGAASGYFCWASHHGNVMRCDVWLERVDVD